MATWKLCSPDCSYNIFVINNRYYQIKHIYDINLFKATTYPELHLLLFYMMLVLQIFKTQTPLKSQMA